MAIDDALSGAAATLAAAIFNDQDAGPDESSTEKRIRLFSNYRWALNELEALHSGGEAPDTTPTRGSRMKSFDGPGASGLDDLT